MMENDISNSCLSSYRGIGTLVERKSLASIRPTTCCPDNDSSVTDPETEWKRQKKIQGDKIFHRLGWKRLVVVLVVECIALGCLSLPGAFATLGMVGGVISSVGIGLIATYASYEIGQVKIKYPEVEHYGDIGRLLIGEAGFWVVGVAFIFQILLSAGSHCLTGIIALSTITQSDVCNVIFGLVSAIALLLLAIPRTFTDMAILGYLDTFSILSAISITVIATGVQSAQHQTGSSYSDWSAWPKENTDIANAMVAINNIVFAYSFAPAIPSFMNEMHTPKDYVKSIYGIGIFQIILYTLVGSLVYVFVGKDVQSPALLSAGPVVARIAFGFALPVIFISGSLNVGIVARYIHSYVYRDSIVRYVNTAKGWITWISLVATITISSWILSEVIPVFSIMLSISASLLSSGLCFYGPSIMWFLLVKEGSWWSWYNIRRSSYNAFVAIFGLGILVLGMYANVIEIVRDRIRTNLFILY